MKASKYITVLLSFLTITAMVSCSGQSAHDRREPSQAASEVSTAPPPPVICSTGQVRYCDGIKQIVELIDTGSTEDSPIDHKAYAESHNILLLTEDFTEDECITWRQACVMIHNALFYNAHPYVLETVTDKRLVNGLRVDDCCERELMFLYRWGILYGPEPADWYAPIPKSSFEELLDRVRSAELRRELLPSVQEQISAKMEKATLCTCLHGTEPSALQAMKESFSDYIYDLSNTMDIAPFLNCSYWILEQGCDRLLSLTMITAKDDDSLDVWRISCNPEKKEQTLTCQTPVPFSVSTAFSEFSENLQYACCITDEDNQQFLQEDYGDYLSLLQRHIDGYSNITSRYSIGYVAPTDEHLSLSFITCQDHTMLSDTFMKIEAEPMSVSNRISYAWYHIFD